MTQKGARLLRIQNRHIAEQYLSGIENFRVHRSLICEVGAALNLLSSRLSMYCFTIVTSCTLFWVVSSHSFVLSPTGDYKPGKNRRCRRGPDLSIDNCGGPCIDRSSWKYNKDEPTTTWSRGSKQKVRWARNNHKTGLVRLSLVPVKLRESHAAHEKFTFQYSCFETGEQDCKSKEYDCGTDSRLYETEVKVPRVKDGLYVLGWSWYGGFSTNGKGDFYEFFGDYYSCSYIRIKGGKKSSKKWKRPKFKPGNKLKRCEALTNKLGVCAVEPCLDAYGENKAAKWTCPYGMKWLKKKCRWGSRGKKRRNKNKRKKNRSKRKKKKQKHKKRKRKQKKRKRKAKKKSNKRKKDKRERKHEKDSKNRNGKDEEPESHSNNDWASTSNDDSKGESSSIERVGEHFMDCPCDARPEARVSFIKSLLVSRLDEHGHRKETKCLCGGRINLAEYPNGLTVLANVVGHARAVRFYADGQVIRTERVRPFSIAGDEFGEFNRWKPPIGREVSVEAVILGDRYKVQVQFDQE